MHPYAVLVRAIGPGFHPDTGGDEYDSLPPQYTPEIVDDIVEQAFATHLDPDPYEIALAIIEEWWP